MVPAGALAVGLIAGTVCTLCFAYLMPSLDRRVGLHDTCGVFHLHGIPGVLGGLVAAAVSAATLDVNAPLLPRGSSTWAYQLAAIGTTMGVAALGDAAAGWLVKWVTPGRLLDVRVAAAGCASAAVAAAARRLPLLPARRSLIMLNGRWRSCLMMPRFGRTSPREWADEDHQRNVVLDEKQIH